jgi:hypothetical protein
MAGRPLVGLAYVNHNHRFLRLSALPLFRVQVWIMALYKDTSETDKGAADPIISVMADSGAGIEYHRHMSYNNGATERGDSARVELMDTSGAPLTGSSFIACYFIPTWNSWKRRSAPCCACRDVEMSKGLSQTRRVSRRSSSARALHSPAHAFECSRSKSLRQAKVEPHVLPPSVAEVLAVAQRHSGMLQKELVGPLERGVSRAIEPRQVCPFWRRHSQFGQVLSNEGHQRISIAEQVLQDLANHASPCRYAASAAVHPSVFTWVSNPRAAPMKR